MTQRQVLGSLVLAAAWCFGPLDPALAGPVRGGDDDEKAEKQIKQGLHDTEFMARVNAAIGRGVQHLLSKASPDGKWASQHEKFQHGPYPHGPTALVLLAILKSGGNRFDERVEKGFKYLKESWDNFMAGGMDWQANRGWRTYEVGITIMALEALGKWKPPGAKSGHKTRAMGGKLKRPELLWVKQLRDFLVKHQTMTRTISVSSGNGTSVEKKYEMWHYPTGKDGSTDHSNSQYAILGLKSAARLGYPAKAKVWLAVFENFMFTQTASGPKVNRVIMPPRKKNKENYFRPHTVSSITDRARGWGYFGHQKPAVQAGSGMGGETGSMTTVGLASVEMAWDELQQLARREKSARKFVRDRKNVQRYRKAINDGYAWLSKNFTVDKNPGHVRSWWHFYYLYGLERAGVMSNRVNIGSHDWYREGGEKLLSMERNGSWRSGAGDGPIGSTCFALLFLARATVPLATTTK